MFKQTHCTKNLWAFDDIWGASYCVEREHVSNSCLYKVEVYDKDGVFMHVASVIAPFALYAVRQVSQRFYRYNMRGKKE